LWKDDVVATRWGDKFDSSDEEKIPDKTSPTVSICGMISFEEMLREINKVVEQLEID